MTEVIEEPGAGILTAKEQREKLMKAQRKGRAAVAKKTKQEINTVWIYPPKAERAAALASADPERVTNL